MLLVAPVKKEIRREMTDEEQNRFGLDKLHAVQMQLQLTRLVCILQSHLFYCPTIPATPAAPVPGQFFGRKGFIQQSSLPNTTKW